VLRARKFGVSRWMVAMMAAAAIQIGVPQAQANTTGTAEQTEHAIARAFSMREGFAGGELTIKILRAPMPANVQLHVVSMQNAPGSQAVLLRLACNDSRDCLPFYAVVRGTKLPALPQSGSLAAPSVNPPAKPLVRAGDRVEIVEQLSGMNLRSRGVCLQAGSIGNRIRVSTLTNHRIVLATIATANLVKVER